MVQTSIFKSLPDVETASCISQVSRTSNDSNLSDEKRVLTNLHKYYMSSQTSSNVSVSCQICCDKMCQEDNYIILSCNHVFHIGCLTEKQYDDMYKYQIIDNDFVSSRKCCVCSTLMQTEELMFLHSKFLNGTKMKIAYHNEKITSLEAKMKNIKDELMACYDYKNKMEYEREKSKQIVASLVTMI